MIRVWDYPRPAPQGVKKWEDHWEYKIFKEFERKHPGVKIEYTKLSWRNGGEKLDIAVLSGNPPDLAGSAFKNVYVERGVLEPIDRFLTHEDSTDILPQALQPFRYNGHIYAWPWYMTVYTLILNKRIFNERHVPIPKDGIWTWDEFVNAMQKLTFDRDGDGKIDVYGIAFTLEPDHNEAWAFIHSEGAKVLIPVKNEAQSGVSAEPNGSRNVSYIDKPIRYSQQAGRKIQRISYNLNDFTHTFNFVDSLYKIPVSGHKNSYIKSIFMRQIQHFNSDSNIYPFLNKFVAPCVSQLYQSKFYTLPKKFPDKLELFYSPFSYKIYRVLITYSRKINIRRVDTVEIVGSNKFSPVVQHFYQFKDVNPHFSDFENIQNIRPVYKYHCPFHRKPPKNTPPIYIHLGGFIDSPLIYVHSQGVIIGNNNNYYALSCQQGKGTWAEKMTSWDGKSLSYVETINFLTTKVGQVPQAFETMFSPFLGKINSIFSVKPQYLAAGLQPSLLHILNSSYRDPTFTLPYRFGFNTPEGIRGVKKLYDLVWKYHVAPPQTGGLSQNETWNMFTEGRVAVTPQGTWAISSLVRTNRERRKRNAEYIAQGKEELVRDTFEFAVANFPIGSTGKVVTASPGVGNWVIFKQKDTTKLRLVMELAREITSAENQRYLKYMGTFPTRKSAGNIYANDPELGPYMSIIIPALENVVMRPFHPRWQQISDAVSRELQLAILGEKSVEQAMRDADRKVREILIQFEISKLKARRSGKKALIITLIIFAILMALIAWGLRKVNLKEHTFAYLALTPVFIIFGVFVIVPIILSVVIAFEQYEPLLGIFRSPFVGFRNFIDVVRDESFRIALKNTFIYTLVKVPWNVSVALILASLLYPLSKKAQSFYRAAYYLPGVASAVVISMIWRWIFDPTFGLANLILTKLGLPPQPWLTSPSTAFPSIILSDILMAPGSGVILYLATMGRIPKSVIESAKIDGAGGIKLWWHVIVPLLAPTTLFMLVVNTIGSFQVFTKIYILTKGGPGYATNTLVFSIYKRAFEDLLFGMASAEALILFVIVGIFSIFQFRMFSRELEY